MMRWIIKGMVIEGLPKNTKKENLLLVFNYELPERLIAQVPIEKRDESRLMVLDREKQTIEKEKKSLTLSHATQ